MMGAPVRGLEQLIKTVHFDTLKRAQTQSGEFLKSASELIESFLTDNSLDANGLAFLAVGSVGRREALEASDLDLIPVARDEGCLLRYAPVDRKLRDLLREELKVEVSQGEDLTKAISLSELVRAETIGGSEDTSTLLTKRVLLMTESMSAGGALPVQTVRESLLDAYANQERTSGRHFLALCNDIARYYKTLCVEYKAKIDTQDKDWGTRNIKLRLSRKLWYFSSIITVIFLAEQFPKGDADFRAGLLKSFDTSPIERLTAALAGRHSLALGRLLENYTLFLEFMAKAENRTALQAVRHEDRYRMEIENPFPTMKFCSDLLHNDIMAILEEIGPAMRGRAMGWFLL